MSSRHARMAFVSPVFLFPNDAGGKIRSTNILRGLRGGRFEVTLVSPATHEQVGRWKAELEGVCSEFVPWRPGTARARWTRAIDVFSDLPANVAADLSRAGSRVVKAVCERADVDLVVFDFVHAAVLAPAEPGKPTVCFTHNVEAEIFARHAEVARDPVRRWLWSSQHRKMKRFEARALAGFSGVIAVSERDAQHFRDRYGVDGARAIPTGVDLEFFSWAPPPAVDADHPPTVVFTGSMDWAANIGGVTFFLERVWPRVLAQEPAARFVVVGRSPPPSLRALARKTRQVEFTGFVDDVRPYAHRAHAFVIPLLVGGGTRIKAFEAMAMGSPVVSTAVGIEGLDVVAQEHFLERDEPAAMADAIVELFRDAAQRERQSRAARRFVEERFGHREVARVFEDICWHTLAGAGRAHPPD